MPQYLDRAALLAALTDLQEQDFPTRDRVTLEQARAGAQAALATIAKDDTAEQARLHAIVLAAEADLQTIALFGGQMRIRELTAAERQQCEQAAWASDPDQADNALFRAMVVSFGLVQPALSLADVAALRGGRGEAVKRVAVAILSLSEAAPGDIKKQSSD